MPSRPARNATAAQDWPPSTNQFGACSKCAGATFFVSMSVRFGETSDTVLVRS